MSIEFDYLAKTLEHDEEILNIEHLYKKFGNKCKIVCYHGSDDNLIPHREKIKLKSIIENFDYNYIDEKTLDNIIFKSANHGLGADFLELFDLAINEYRCFESSNELQNKNVYYETSKCKYSIDYNDIMPVLSIK